MDDNISLLDLRTGIEILETSLKEVCVNFIDCFLYESEKTVEDYCLCGCMSLPVADLLFRVQKPTFVRLYGLKVYPTKKCPICILNCENKGAVIKYEIYEIVKSWLNSIPREQERQAARLALFKKELFERTYPRLSVTKKNKETS